MAKKKRRVMTLADYVVIAFSPALIMTLVGSLVFFLLEISYTGQYRGRMLWVLGWFVFGAVLVARIGIQQGREQATLFGAVLAGVVCLATARFVDQVFVAFVLLGIIWWCAWKLTWDCTLIDDSQDASGEGLLQAARLTTDQQTSPPQTAEKTTKEKPDKSTPAPHEESLDHAKSRPHAPGLWVVYFSLAALPLFGIGQLMIPAQEVARRSYSFQLLMIYVASGLGLLLSTSFLGMRRYLRQRNLSMPTAITASWLLLGSVLGVCILLLALFLPRPQGEHTLTALVNRVDQQLREASRFAPLRNGQGVGAGRPGEEQNQEQGEPATDQPQNEKPGRPSDHSGDNPANNSTADKGKEQSQQQGKSSQSSSEKNRSSSSSQNDKGENNSEQQSKSQESSPENSQRLAQKNNTEQSQQDSSETSNQQTPSQSPANPQMPHSLWTNFLTTLSPLFKWLVYGALLVLALFFFLAYREQVLAFANQLWLTFLGLFGGSSEQTASETEDQAPLSPPRPFSEFQNPFHSGAYRRMTPSAIIIYTFDALEAWSRERGQERTADQTPLEFGEKLSRREAKLATEIRQTTRLYAGVAYGDTSPGKDSLAVLERLWSRLI